MMSNFESVCAKFIESNEGRSYTTYADSLGVPNIGVGFNLTREDAPKRIADLGVNYDRILQGLSSLNDEQVNKLLLEEVRSSIRCCRIYYEEFESIDESRKVALVDLAFNLGPDRLWGFTKFIACINEREFDGARSELIDSLYFKQVEARATRNSEIIATGTIALFVPKGTI